MRTTFLSNLSGFGIDDLESYTARTITNSLTFVGAGVTATPSLTSDGPAVFPPGVYIVDPATDSVPGGAGRFPTSGKNYIELSEHLTLDFSTPVAAFGLFVTDFGDVDNDSTPDKATRSLGTNDALLGMRIERQGKPDEEVLVPYTFQSPDQSGLFFGVIDSTDLISSITLLHGTSGLPHQPGAWRDGYAYDDFLVATADQVVEQSGGGQIPEPASALLFGAGLLSLGLLRRRLT